MGRMEEANGRLQDKVQQLTDDELRSLKSLTYAHPWMRKSEHQDKVGAARDSTEGMSR